MLAILLLFLISLGTECTAQDTTDSLACTLVSQLNCGKFPVKVLCATNGQEFQNDCEFAHAHCHYPSIRLYKEGPCPQTGSLDVNGTLAVDVVCKAIGASDCPPDTWEVCANNGVTYHNLCQYQKQHCKHPEIQIVKTGACVGQITTTMTSHNTSTPTKHPSTATSSDFMLNTTTASHTTTAKSTSIPTTAPRESTSHITSAVETSTPAMSTSTTPSSTSTTTSERHTHVPKTSPSATTSAKYTSTTIKTTAEAATTNDTTKSPATSSATSTTVTTSAPAAATTSTVTTSAASTSAVTTSDAATTTSTETTSAAASTSPATTSAATTSAVTTSAATTTVNMYCQILETAACPTNVELLCGTDGVTYTNMCHLDKVKCHQPWLDTRHDGTCHTTTTSTTSVTTTHPSLSAICQALVSAECDPHMEQMCGSDGITYDNKCELEKGRCYQPGLQVVYDGSCRTTTTQTPVMTTMDFICEALILGQCQPNVDEVCASNSVTYRNMCMFQQAKCRNKFLKDIHMGKCSTPHVANSKDSPVLVRDVECEERM